MNQVIKITPNWQKTMIAPARVKRPSLVDVEGVAGEGGDNGDTSSWSVVGRDWGYNKYLRRGPPS